MGGRGRAVAVRMCSWRLELVRRACACACFACAKIHVSNLHATANQHPMSPIRPPCAGGRARGGGGHAHGAALPLLQRLPDLCVPQEPPAVSGGGRGELRAACVFALAWRALSRAFVWGCPLHSLSHPTTLLRLPLEPQPSTSPFSDHHQHQHHINTTNTTSPTPLPHHHHYPPPAPPHRPRGPRAAAHIRAGGAAAPGAAGAPAVAFGGPQKGRGGGEGAAAAGDAQVGAWVC